LKRWYDNIEARPAVQKGMAVMANGPALQPNDKETFSVLFGAQQYQRR
jgi:GSH-dependent disulfide-bond oxidoreductase